MLRSLQDNDIGDEGASALAAVLKETQISNLECAATRVFAFASTPLDKAALLPSSLARSLDGDNIGDRGASALAAVLNETRISQLKCATTPSVCFPVSAR